MNNKKFTFHWWYLQKNNTVIKYDVCKIYMYERIWLVLLFYCIFKDKFQYFSKFYLVKFFVHVSVLLGFYLNKTQMLQSILILTIVRDLSFVKCYVMHLFKEIQIIWTYMPRIMMFHVTFSPSFYRMEDGSTENHLIESSSEILEVVKTRFIYKERKLVFQA